MIVLISPTKKILLFHFSTAGTNYCQSPHYFAYNYGTDCCDTHFCSDYEVLLSSTECCGESVPCTANSDNLTLVNNCGDAGECGLFSSSTVPGYL